MLGMCSRGNWMSTTAPMHCTMVPILMLDSSKYVQPFKKPPPKSEVALARGRAGVFQQRQAAGKRRETRTTLLVSRLRKVQEGLVQSFNNHQTAAAPPTISDSSLVIAACRVLL